MAGTGSVTVPNTTVLLYLLYSFKKMYGGVKRIKQMRTKMEAYKQLYYNTTLPVDIINLIGQYLIEGQDSCEEYILYKRRCGQDRVILMFKDTFAKR